jgi:ribosomal protein L40E
VKHFTLRLLTSTKIIYEHSYNNCLTEGDCMINEIIFFNCPHCQSELKLPPEVASPGEIIECPACYKNIQVPRPQPITKRIAARKPTPPSPSVSTKPCPYCGKSNPTFAIKCKHCGSDFVEAKKHQPSNLRKCRGCGQTVHPTAETCPHCGIKNPVITKTSTENNADGAGCILISIVIVIVVCIWGYRSCCSMFDIFKLSPEQQAESNKRRRLEERVGSKDGAYIMSQQFVKEILKSPRSAKFPWYDNSFVTDLGDGRYVVYAYVDAQNAYGAMMRTKYMCTIKYTGNDNWRCIGVEMLE